MSKNKKQNFFSNLYALAPTRFVPAFEYALRNIKFCCFDDDSAEYIIRCVYQNHDLLFSKRHKCSWRNLAKQNNYDDIQITFTLAHTYSNIKRSSADTIIFHDYPNPSIIGFGGVEMNIFLLVLSIYFEYVLDIEVVRFLDLKTDEIIKSVTLEIINERMYSGDETDMKIMRNFIIQNRDNLSEIIETCDRNQWIELKMNVMRIIEEENLRGTPEIFRL